MWLSHEMLIVGVLDVQKIGDHAETLKGLVWRSGRGRRAGRRHKGIAGNLGEPSVAPWDQTPERGDRIEYTHGAWPVGFPGGASEEVEPTQGLMMQRKRECHGNTAEVLSVS